MSPYKIFKLNELNLRNCHEVALSVFIITLFLMFCFKPKYTKSLKYLVLNISGDHLVLLRETLYPSTGS